MGIFKITTDETLRETIQHGKMHLHCCVLCLFTLDNLFQHSFFYSFDIELLIH